MSGSGRKNKRYAKAFNPYEINTALNRERRKLKKEEIEANVSKKVDALKSGVDNARISIKIAFWNWLFKTARHLAAQDIKTPHEVLISSNPNPNSTGIAAGGAGAVAIAMKGVQLIMLPIQKGIQYWIWKNQPDPVAPTRPKKDLDENNEQSLREWTAYSEKQKQFRRELLEKEYLKPRFTRRDAAYLALDITMLALTIATFAVAAPYAAAAIALTAACVSFAVAAYHVGKFIHHSNKLKKDISVIDNFLENFDSKSDKEINQFLKEQGYHFTPGLTSPSREQARDYLTSRSDNLNTALKEDKQNVYTKFRQTFGLGLTMMMVVGAGLMLGGVALGPYGAPLIAAGMALSITAGVIAFGMFVVNAIKNKRAHTKARTSVSSDSEDISIDLDDDIELDKIAKPPNISEALTKLDSMPNLAEKHENTDLARTLHELCGVLEDINTTLSSLEVKLVTPVETDMTLSSSKSTLLSKKAPPRKDEKTEATTQPQPKLE